MRWFAHSACSICLVIQGAHADSNLFGHSGTVRMPDARFADNPQLRAGVTVADSFHRVWGTFDPLPWAQLTLRHEKLSDGARILTDDGPSSTVRAADLKLKLRGESRRLPALAVGRQDLDEDEGVAAFYISSSKRFGDFDFTVGYGSDYFDAPYYAVRYRPFDQQRIGFLFDYVELDGSDEQQLKRIGLKDGAAVGVEYRLGPLGVLAAYQSGEASVGLSLNFALTRRPRQSARASAEPGPVAIVGESAPASADRGASQPSNLDWRFAGGDAATGAVTSDGYLQEVVLALEQLGYTRVAIAERAGRLSLRFADHHGLPAERASGRAVRILHRLSPPRIGEFFVTVSSHDLPLYNMRITDRSRLDAYYAARLAFEQLSGDIEIRRYHAGGFDGVAGTTATALKSTDRTPVPRDTSPLAASWASADGSAYALLPVNIDVYTHDPDVPLRAELFSLAQASYRIARGWELDGAVRFTWWENVNEFDPLIDDTLPHVRSDLPDYKDDFSFTLDTLMLNHYFALGDRWFGNLSGGLFEEMYGGVGAQVLHLLPVDGFALDLKLHWVTQRDTDGAFGFRDHDVVTALAALHWHLPLGGLTATVRGGQFLADDLGVRFELATRLNSGINFGFWYTVSDERDNKFIGSPERSYNDRGLFFEIPIGILTGDTQRRKASFALRPWLRDAGQMLALPNDLYNIVRDGVSQSTTNVQWLEDFGQ